MARLSGQVALCLLVSVATPELVTQGQVAVTWASLPPPVLDRHRAVLSAMA